jgi:hypothetical protein
MICKILRLFIILFFLRLPLRYDSFRGLFVTPSRKNFLWLWRLLRSLVIARRMLITFIPFVVISFCCSPMSGDTMAVPQNFLFGVFNHAGDISSVGKPPYPFLDKATASSFSVVFV